MTKPHQTRKAGKSPLPITRKKTKKDIKPRYWEKNDVRVTRWGENDTYGKFKVTFKERPSSKPLSEFDEEMLKEYDPKDPDYEIDGQGNPAWKRFFERKREKDQGMTEQLMKQDRTIKKNSSLAKEAVRAREIRKKARDSRSKKFRDLIKLLNLAAAFIHKNNHHLSKSNIAALMLKKIIDEAYDENNPYIEKIAPLLDQCPPKFLLTAAYHDDEKRPGAIAYIRKRINLP